MLKVQQSAGFCRKLKKAPLDSTDLKMGTIEHFNVYIRPHFSDFSTSAKRLNMDLGLILFRNIYKLYCCCSYDGLMCIVVEESGCRASCVVLFL